MPNKKGMTLVEMVVTIAILAIAGTILVAGFASVISHMGNATLVKNTSNEVFSSIESNAMGDATQQEGTIRFHFASGDVWEDQIYLTSIKKPIDGMDSYQVELKKYSTDNADGNTTKTFYEMVKASYHRWSNISAHERQTQYTSKREELLAEGFQITNEDVRWITNDAFRWIFTVFDLEGSGFPEIDREVIAKCNAIYEKNNPLFLNNKIYYGDKKVYMKPYLLVKKGYPILYAVPELSGSEVVEQNGWRTSLIYNPEDQHWYYKVFHATSNQDDLNSYYNLTLFSNLDSDDRIVWEQLLNDFKDPNKWQRIELEK